MKKLSIKSLLIFFIVMCFNEINAQEHQSQLRIKNFNSDCSNNCGSTELKGGIALIELSEIQLKQFNNSKYNVILTPSGSWSALYVKEINEKGFVVKSESGDLNAKFFWTITAVPSITETHEDIKH